jgi:Ca-activated chloride channel family protein
MKKILFRISVLLMLAVVLAGGACATSGHPQTQPYTPPTYNPPIQSYPSANSTSSIGLAVGGAKDINNFRNNIQNNFLPLPTDVTYEGLFYDYYFDTGAVESSDKLFYPSYSYAVTRDPLSHQTEYYLSVGLNSGLKESDFERKKLNLVIVLDNSGSMGEYFNQYYYDNTGKQIDIYNEDGVNSQRKIDNANEAIVSILNQLGDGDRFAVVLFNSDASVLQPMELVGNTNMNVVRNRVLNIAAGGSTNLDAGMDLATRQFKGLSELNSYDYENRIIVLTDAQPNTGDISSSNFMDSVERNAGSRIYTTFIGVGVDFNTQLIERITKVKGANYYTVHSHREFNRRVNEEFDFMVTPLVFNLKFYFEAEGWKIDQVFGSPEADQASGTLMTINTMFPSRSEGGENKGGIVLLKLRETSSNPGNTLYLKVNYEDRNGKKDTSQAVIHVSSHAPEYFGNSGIRKAVLLVRYAALLKNWMIDERGHMHYSKPWDPRIGEETGITIPNENGGQWERTSLPLYVSPWYRSIFSDFSRYFEGEMDAIGDSTLNQEMRILAALN